MKKLLSLVLCAAIMATLFCLPVVASSTHSELTIAKSLTNIAVGTNTQGFADKTIADGVFVGTTNSTWANLVMTFGITDISSLRDTGYISMKVKTSSVPTKIEVATGVQEPIIGTNYVHYTKNNTTVNANIAGARANEWFEVLVPLSAFAATGKCYVAHAGTEWTTTHDIPYDFSYTQNLQLAITAEAGTTVEVKEVGFYELKESLGDQCHLDVFGKKLANTNNSVWQVKVDGTSKTVSESTDATTGEKYVSAAFNQEGRIVLQAQNKYSGWSDLSSYRGKGYLVKMTLKVPEGKMPTGDVKLDLVDSAWLANQNSISVKDQFVEGEWFDIYVPFDSFGAKNASGGDFKFNDMKWFALTSQTEAPAEVLLKGISLCSKNDTWWRPILGGRLLGSSITKVDPWNATVQAIAGYSENATDGYLTITPNAEQAVSFFEINTANSVNLSAVYQNSFLRIKMKTTEVPSEFHVCGMKGSYNGGLQKINITSWNASTSTADNWVVLDIPATTFLKEALVNSQNRTITGFNFKFVYATAGEHAPIDIAEIAVYGPEKKFEVTNFQIKKGDAAVSEYVAGDVLTLSATVHNTRSLSENITVIGALYNDEGLINVQPCGLTSNAYIGTTELTGTYTIPADVAGTTFRAFVWDSISGVTPLFESVSAEQVPSTEA